MTTVAKIQAELDLDTGRFVGGLVAADGKVRKFSTTVDRAEKSLKRIDRGVNGFGGSLRDSMIVLGQFRAAMHTLWMFTGEWVRALVDANAKLERMQILMKGLSTATTEAGRTTEALKDMNYVLNQAKNAPFAIDEIANSFVKLKASGIDPTKGAMTALTNAVAAFGGDDQIFHRATIAIQQMSGKGVISMEELRQQLGEAIPNAMQLMARSMNMTVGELVKTIASGRLEAKSALDKLFLEMKFQFDGSAKELMGTWTGMVSRLKTEWMIFAKEIGDAGMFAAAKDALQSLTNFLKGSEGKKFAHDMAQTLTSVASAFGQMIRWLVDNREELIKWGKVLIAVFAVKQIYSFTRALVGTGSEIISLAGNIGTMNQAWRKAGTGISGFASRMSMLSGPLALAAAGIAAVTLALWENKRAYENAARAARHYQDATERGIAVNPEQHREMLELVSFLGTVQSRIDEIRSTVSPRQGGILLNDLIKDLSEFGLLKAEDGLIIGGFDTRMKAIEEAVATGFDRVSSTAEQQILQNQSRIEDATQNYATFIEERFGKVGGDISASLTKLFEKFNEGDITKEQYEEKRNEIVGKKLDAQIEGLKETKRRQQVMLDDAKGNELVTQQLTQIMEVTNDKLLQAMEHRANLAKGPVLLNNKTDDGSQQSPLVKFLNGLIGKHAELTAQLEGGLPSLKEFDALLLAGHYGKDIDGGMVAKIRELIASVDDLENKVDRQKATDKLASALEELEASTAADIVSARMDATGDMYSQVAAGMVGLNRQIAILELGLDGTNMSREKFNEWVVKLKTNVAEVDFTNLTRFVENASWESYLDSLPRRARDQAEFNRRLQEMWTMMEQMKRDNPGRAGEIDQQGEILERAIIQDYMNATKPAWKSLLDEWKDTTTSMDQMWAQSMDRMANTLVEFITTGKGSFRDLATFMLKEITRILISKALAQLVEIIMQITGSFIGGGGGGMANKAMTIGKNADGGVFENGVKRFADGGAFTNKITTGTNLAPMAMFGEAGAEAIMPLTRDASGRLGVTASGSGGGVINQITIEINIDGDGNSSENSNGDMGTQGAALGQAVKARVKQTLSEEMMPGGILYNIRTGR